MAIQILITIEHLDDKLKLSYEIARESLLGSYQEDEIAKAFVDQVRPVLREAKKEALGYYGSHSLIKGESIPLESALIAASKACKLFGAS